MFMNSMGQPNSQISEQSFAMSMLDIMKAHGIDPWSVTQGQIMQNNHSQLPFFAQHYGNSAILPVPDQQPFPLTFGTNHNISAQSLQSPPSPESSIAPSSPRSGMLLPSLRRKSPPPSPPSTSLCSQSKGKGRAVSPSRSKRKSTHTSTPSQSLYTAEITPLPHTQTDKIFILETGKELAFFVQIDLNNRLAVVNNIKVRSFKLHCFHTT
jgi:hypothetical protein